MDTQTQAEPIALLRPQKWLVKPKYPTLSMQVRTRNINNLNHDQTIHVLDYTVNKRHIHIIPTSIVNRKHHVIAASIALVLFTAGRDVQQDTELVGTHTHTERQTQVRTHDAEVPVTVSATRQTEANAKTRRFAERKQTVGDRKQASQARGRSDDCRRCL